MPQQVPNFAIRVILFRIPAHFPEASQAESSIRFLLFVEADPTNLLLSSFAGDRCIDNDGTQPGNESRLPAKPFNISDSAQHRLLNQVVRFIYIRRITGLKATLNR